MGIRGLQTFMERGTDGKVCQKVKFKDIIQDYKRKHSVENAVILIDANSTLITLYQKSGVDWICGGQYADHAEKITDLVTGLRRAGAEPIFFYDGPCTEQKRPEWVNRKVERYTDIQNVMTTIKDEKSVDGIRPFFVPNCIGLLQRYVLARKCKCEVIVSVIEECDEEIASYAKKNENVVGIVAQDSDFVMFDYDKYYFSADKINLAEMSTILYNRTRLATLHGISINYFPIIASMLCNDYLKRDKYIERFHRRISNWEETSYPRLEKVFPAVVAIVKKKFKLEMSIDEMCDNVCDEMFGESVTSGYKQCVFHSLKTYFVLNTSEPKSAESYSERLLETVQRHFNFASQTGLILTQACIDHGNEMEDLESNYDPIVFIYDPINSRYAGLLRKHLELEPNANVIKEYAVYSKHSVENPKALKVTFPPFEVNLLNLLANISEESKSLKFKILFWTLSGLDPISSQGTSIFTDFIAVFKRIRPKFQLCSLALFYLYQIERIINDSELETFLTMFALIGSRKINADSNVDPFPNYRAVHLASLFNAGVRAIGRVASVLLDVLPPVAFCISFYFDGVLFQKLFKNEYENLEITEESGSSKKDISAIFNFVNFFIPPDLIKS